MDLKENLKNQLIALRHQRDEIQKQLDELDHEERLAVATQYKGRFFRQVDNYLAEGSYIQCVYVYGVDTDRCETMALRVGYWNASEVVGFAIEHDSMFRHDEDREDGWTEISKDEFMSHYKQVQQRIVLASPEY